MGIKLSKQTPAEPYPESYHGSSTRFTQPEDSWILVHSSKLNKMKKKLMLRKDSASINSNTFNTSDPKECMANTSKPIEVKNIDNSALYAYKVNKVHINSKAKHEQHKGNKKRKAKKHKKIKTSNKVLEASTTMHGISWTSKICMNLSSISIMQ